MEKEKSDTLSVDMIEALLLNCTPAAPAPDRREAMRRNIVARIRSAPKALITIRDADGNWIEVASGIYRKHLFSNGRTRAVLYRMLAGSAFPAHEHPSDEECVCLQGEVSLGGIVITAGDFHLAPQGASHGVISTATGCILYIRTGATADLGDEESP
jgi:anti-sigma factor ChrR (cupin superfamily)